MSAAMKPTGQDGGRLHLATRLAWDLALVAVAIGLGASVLVVLTGTPLAEVIAGHTAVGIMLGLGFPPLGALIVARHPRHPIGWLPLVAGLTQSLVNFAGLYATYALQTRPGSLPGGAVHGMAQRVDVGAGLRDLADRAAAAVSHRAAAVAAVATGGMAGRRGNARDHRADGHRDLAVSRPAATRRPASRHRVRAGRPGDLGRHGRGTGRGWGLLRWCHWWSGCGGPAAWSASSSSGSCTPVS